MSVHSIRRIIRRTGRNVDEDGDAAGPGVVPQLAPIGETAGHNIKHTFRARSVAMLETVTWACGYPVGWGKCYNAEGDSQVLTILNNIWDGFFNQCPSFLVFDRACDLLWHIVTQNVNDSWLQTTTFIVDAWHYIGHRARDIICRMLCNPTPRNGSQPNLVITETDPNGNAHTTQAFNTDTGCKGHFTWLVKLWNIRGKIVKIQHFACLYQSWKNQITPDFFHL